MAYTPRSDYIEKMVNLEPFRGSSARAEWEGNVYVVYSYQTKIAAWSHKKDLIFFDNKSYSSTTSCLQNYIGGAVYKLNGSLLGSYYRRNGYLYYKKDTSDDLYCKHIYVSSKENFDFTKHSLIDMWNTKQTSQVLTSDNPLEVLKNKLLQLATD